MLRIALFAIALLTVPASAQTGKAEVLTVDGRQRRFELFDPGGTEKPALVIMLHGGGGNAQNAAIMSQFNALAAKEGFIVAYPEGSGRLAPRLLTWNAGHCCAYAMSERVDDVGYISALIDHLVMTRNVDPKRVYVTGMSNGAMMTHRLGIALSDKIAAIAPVVGGVFGDEAPPKAPVPAMIIVGAEDRIVPGAGGALGLEGEAASLVRRPAADRPIRPAEDAALFWAKANGCRRSRTERLTAATLRSWTGCRRGADVRYYVVKANGHAWPGGRAGRTGADQPTPAFDATAAIWAFFEKHPRR
jgi:polyhydroxybutyrate depolymerase